MRPAFYALRPGGWRDYVTLLHPPYTAWHLANVVIGGCLAPSVPWGRLALTVLAFGLALGIGAHALDELNGRPLNTRIPSAVLVGLTIVSVAGACALGIAVASRTSWWLLAFVAVGAFLVPAYNLELLGGRFHTTLWLGLAWGAFPVLTAYVACAETIRVEAVAAAGWAMLLVIAQRALSTPVRHIRRRVRSVDGTFELTDGTHEVLSRELLVAGPEAALRLMAASTILLAVAMVAFRL
ncbi:MAG: hypothetical protein ABI927_05765 [Gaiellaceae bacterium]